MSTPAWSSRVVGPVSPDMLQPSRELSLPTSQCDMLNPEPAAITIVPPAYVLFADPFDSVNTLSSLRVSRFLGLPAPPGFTPMGPPGSLPMPSVIVDMMSLDLPLPVQPASLLSSGPLSPGQTQPMVQETSAVCHTLSSSVPIAAIDSLVEPDLTESLSPLATVVPDVCSSPIVSSTYQLNHRSLSPDSVRSDGSF